MNNTNADVHNKHSDRFQLHQYDPFNDKPQATALPHRPRPTKKVSTATKANSALPAVDFLSNINLNLISTFSHTYTTVQHINAPLPQPAPKNVAPPCALSPEEDLEYSGADKMKAPRWYHPYNPAKSKPRNYQTSKLAKMVSTQNIIGNTKPNANHAPTYYSFFIDTSKQLTQQGEIQAPQGMQALPPLSAPGYDWQVRSNNAHPSSSPLRYHPYNARHYRHIQADPKDSPMHVVDLTNESFDTSHELRPASEHSQNNAVARNVRAANDYSFFMESSKQLMAQKKIQALHGTQALPSLSDSGMDVVDLTNASFDEINEVHPPSERNQNNAALRNERAVNDYSFFMESSKQLMAQKRAQALAREAAMSSIFNAEFPPSPMYRSQFGQEANAYENGSSHTAIVPQPPFWEGEADHWEGEPDQQYDTHELLQMFEHASSFSANENALSVLPQGERLLSPLVNFSEDALFDDSELDNMVDFENVDYQLLQEFSSEETRQLEEVPELIEAHASFEALSPSAILLPGSPNLPANDMHSSSSVYTKEETLRLIEEYSQDARTSKKSCFVETISFYVIKNGVRLRGKDVNEIINEISRDLQIDFAGVNRDYMEVKILSFIHHISEHGYNRMQIKKPSKLDLIRFVAARFPQHEDVRYGSIPVEVKAAVHALYFDNHKWNKYTIAGSVLGYIGRATKLKAHHALIDMIRKKQAPQFICTPPPCVLTPVEEKAHVERIREYSATWETVCARFKSNRSDQPKKKKRARV